MFAYTAPRSRYTKANHSVYMTFFFRSGWQVQFTEANLKTPLPRRFTFSDPEKDQGTGTARGSSGGLCGSNATTGLQRVH